MAGSSFTVATHDRVLLSSKLVRSIIIKLKTLVDTETNFDKNVLCYVQA